MKTIILNHKSYLSVDEIEKFKKEIEKINIKDIELVLMPNLAYLYLFKSSKVKIGTQNFYSYNFGSYTGEISLESLKSLNIHYTLIGHPERLLLKLDKYEEIKDKLLKSINSGFKTILCVGHDENLSTLKKELKYYLKGIEYKAIKNLIIAYEPESRIEGNTVDLDEIEYVKDFIKKYSLKNFDEEVKFVYGGSVSKDNIKEVLEITDGVILGKISTDIKELKELLKELA